MALSVGCCSGEEEEVREREKERINSNSHNILETYQALYRLRVSLEQGWIVHRVGPHPRHELLLPRHVE